MPREDRERVRDRIQHEVVPPLGVVQERSSVLDVHGHPRILIRAVGVKVAAQPIEERVDLDGVDVSGSSRQSDRNVIAAAGPDDQHVVERVARCMPVRLEPEGLDRLHDEAIKKLNPDAKLPSSETALVVTR